MINTTQKKHSFKKLDSQYIIKTEKIITEAIISVPVLHIFEYD